MAGRGQQHAGGAAAQGVGQPVHRAAGAATPQHGAGEHSGRRQGQHQQTQAVLHRLARTEGHLRAVSRMVEEGRDCADVLIQLAAVRAAVDRVARIVLEDHVESCLRQAASNGTTDQEWESLKTALDRFIS